MLNAHVSRCVLASALAGALVACSVIPTNTRQTSVPTATSQPAETPVPTNLPIASATVAEPTATSGDVASPAPVSDDSAQDFAPEQRSVWNTTIGQDVMRGTCTKGSVLPAYGLVQITPITGEGGNGELEWKNQEPKPYAMSRVNTNEYQYAGPNSINDGLVTMTLTFRDEKNLTMLREYTANSDPACTHTHEYTGVFQWFR